MSTGSTGSFIPKWQLAVILGAPIAIGLSYFYYRKHTAAVEDADKSKKKLSNIKGQTISIDGDDKSNVHVAPEEEPKKTPLEQATQYKNEGNVNFKKGLYEEAIKLYSLAIDTCPRTSQTDLSTFYQNRAAAFEQLKKWAEVRDDCTKALELNSRYVKALHRRSRAHHNLGELIPSLEDITATGILEGFQNNSTLAYADRVLKEIGQNDAKKAMLDRKAMVPSETFILTYFSSFTQDPIQVIKFSEDQKQNPKGFVRAKVAFEKKKFDDVLDACTEEIDADGQYKHEAKLLRGTFYLLMGKTPEAAEDLDDLISNENVNNQIKVNALIKKASLAVQGEEAQLGFNIFAVAEQIDPKNADIYHQRGQVYTLIDQIDLAVKEFKTAVELAPKQGMSYVQKCYAEYRQAITNQSQEALFNVINEFKKAIEKFPDCIESYSVFAQVLTEQGQYDQADMFFEKSIAMAPKTASLYVHRGIMQLQWNGDVEKAIGYMNNGIQIDEKCELAYETLGTIEVQRGNLENAVQLFSKAIILAKSEAEMVHLYSLKNAASAQINVAKKLGIDMSSLSAFASGNM